MKIIQVTSCKDCPFFVNEDRAEYCNAPIIKYAPNVSIYEIPEDCPLEIKPIMVVIKKNNFER